MSTLILMNGLPGSGKSTEAKKLAEENNGIILSTDNFFMKNNHYDFNINFISEAHSWNLGLCNHLLYLEHPYIIIDNTNLTFFSVKRYFESAIKFRCSIEFKQANTAWANDVEECFKRNTHSVPLETLQKMQKNRESIESMLNKYKEMVNNDF